MTAPTDEWAGERQAWNDHQAEVNAAVSKRARWDAAISDTSTAHELLATAVLNLEKAGREHEARKLRDAAYRVGVVLIRIAEGP